MGRGFKTPSFSGAPSPSPSPSFVFFESAHIWYVSFPVYLHRPPSPGNDSPCRTLFVVSTAFRLAVKLGYPPIDKRGADLLFQVVAARCECGSIVVSTHRAFRDWSAIFNVNNTLATALIDRLMHHARGDHPSRRNYRIQHKPAE
jgi:hypothetical protein